MPAPRRLIVPIAGRRGSQRVSFVAVVLTIVALGGAVAGVYTTGVTLGTRIAPADDDRAVDRPGRDEGEASTDPGGTSPGTDITTDTEATDGATSLPDRAQGSDASTSTSTTTTPGSSGAGQPGTTSPGAAGTSGASTGEPYPGLWPYSSWDEVRQHQDAGDPRFSTAADTALRFAREVVGLTGPSVGAVDEGDVDARVEVRSGRGSSLVRLARIGADGTSQGAPWAVTGARGAVGLDAPATSGGPSLPVTSDASPGVVGVHDRTGWRGVGVAVRPGATIDLRLDPGPVGPAMVVAFGGDPREPTTFTVQRVELGGSGAPAPTAPSDPVAATAALVDAARRGDVSAVWELLTPDARASVRDWRGMAGRLPGLRESLSTVATGPLTTTTVATGAGPVAVVAPSIGAGASREGTIPALAFVVTGGARLASLEPGAVTWSGPQGADLSVVASGPSRPVALVVDGGVWSAAPVGATGLRAEAGTLAAGTHLAIAVVDDGGRISASAYLFERPGLLDGTEDQPAGPTTAPATVVPESSGRSGVPGDGATTTARG